MRETDDVHKAQATEMTDETLSELLGTDLLEKLIQETFLEQSQDGDDFLGLQDQAQQGQQPAISSTQLVQVICFTNLF